MAVNNWKIPEPVLNDASQFFDHWVLQDARKLFRQSRVSISYAKGSAENYYIVSGIVRDSRAHESKIVFKKRLEGSANGPLATTCDCHLWSQIDHCPHVACLFLNFNTKEFFESQGEQNYWDSNLPPLAALSNMGVNVIEYGSIIAGPHKLEGAPTNSAYSSLQYLLHHKKVINFPIPKNMQGKLIISLTSQEKFDDETQSFNFSPMVQFQHMDEDGKIWDKISLFENLYLFNWENGDAFHLSNELKTLVQKIRIHYYSLSINDLIQFSREHRRLGICDITIDSHPFDSIEIKPTHPRITINSSTKKNQLEFTIYFHNDEERKINIPEFLKNFTFTGGMLGSFRKKKDSYVFIRNLNIHIKNPLYSYKKSLLQSNKKDRWQFIIETTMSEHRQTIVYEEKLKSLYAFDNDVLINIFSNIYDHFGEMFFRFSEYNREGQELNFQVAASTIFQGLSAFHHKLTPFGVTLYYNRNEVSYWSTRVKFERQQTTNSWFELSLSLSETDIEMIKKVDLDQGLVVAGDNLVLLSNEQKDVMRFLKKYTKYEARQVAPGDVPEEQNPEDPELGEKTKTFILPFNRSRIFELFELKRLGVDGALTAEEEKLCEKLSTMQEMPQYEIPAPMDKVLREYQKVGYNWLRFLYEHKLGACLADDMGLGKTLQAITLIKALYPKLKRVLIVCPVTILLNWEKEFEKFCDLPVAIYHGGTRTFPEDVKIIVTSYGVMKKEHDSTLKNIHFDIMILDEVQQLKNIRSLGAFAARTIDADFRICLTGTPVENDLAEFFNILDLCVPGVWGDLQFIRTKSNQKSRLLARKTAAPFILRRTKAQVLTDLPPKIENNVYLNFTDWEREQYKLNLLSIRKKITVANSRKKYGEILRGLLQLRQNCLWQKHAGVSSHTAHIPGAADNLIESTKIDFLTETLDTILAEGHQAIVFSQFTTYLDIIQSTLREKHIKIARIDGSQSIKKRQEQVDIFQAGKTPVFLISLKAGGVGLNLTAASYVFLMDPWWNPAVEAQAIDRAHRIGQENKLTVYRPIIKDTVEEKVLALQEIKKQLFFDLLPENDDSFFTGKLSMKDFEALFEE